MPDYPKNLTDFIRFCQNTDNITEVSTEGLCCGTFCVSALLVERIIAGTIDKRHLDSILQLINKKYQMSLTAPELISAAKQLSTFDDRAYFLRDPLLQWLQDAKNIDLQDGNSLTPNQVAFYGQEFGFEVYNIIPPKHINDPIVEAVHQIELVRPQGEDDSALTSLNGINPNDLFMVYKAPSAADAAIDAVGHFNRLLLNNENQRQEYAHLARVVLSQIAQNGRTTLNKIDSNNVIGSVKALLTTAQQEYQPKKDLADEIRSKLDTTEDEINPEIKTKINAYLDNFEFDGLAKYLKSNKENVTKIIAHAFMQIIKLIKHFYDKYLLGQSTTDPDYSLFKPPSKLEQRLIDCINNPQRLRRQ